MGKEHATTYHFYGMPNTKDGPNKIIVNPLPTIEIII